MNASLTSTGGGLLARVPVHEAWAAGILNSVPEALRGAMLADPAMRPRSMARLFARLGIREPDLRRFSPDSRRILAHLMAAPRRFCGLSGLVWRAHALGQAITPEAVRPLRAAFRPEDLSLALSLRLFAPRAMPSGALTPQTVEQAGEALCQAWSASAGQGLDRIVRLMLPTMPEQAVNLGNPAFIILGALAYRLGPPPHPGHEAVTIRH